MSEPQTRLGRAHLDLLARLSVLRTEELELGALGFRFFAEVAITPHMWPMDDVYFEFLLAAARFDLDQDDDLEEAMYAVAFLAVADPSFQPLTCGHDDAPTRLCLAVHASDWDAAFAQVRDFAAAGVFELVDEARIERFQALRRHDGRSFDGT